ncbi:hypothetical protein [Mucilaginibacter paludis]|uniref:Uncharacterized protein n=1 Tax=Mucilaginibacter paludis DSM 18603 TaxID=714943 RepID=H1Y783_9SPHI|nr:hypothetical protein [Mucilaginibacter paludis]EHQ28970.1 hypothetical protein Mucpa_4886 [Mucilaginibacter paludis DSM 18603]
MLGLFKRTKIKQWEITLLNNTLSSLPNTYAQFKLQINSNLFRGVLIGMGDILGYVAFTYHNEVYQQFYDAKGRNFKLTRLKVFDQRSKTYQNFTLYFSHGVINGYSIDDVEKHDLSVDDIITNDYSKQYIGNGDYKKIEAQLTDYEKQLINPVDVYEVKLNGHIYFHIQQLQDGNFIAVDLKKIVYEIRHDPFQISPLPGNLSGVIGGKGPAG